KRMLDVEKRCLFHDRETTAAEVKRDDEEHEFWRCLHAISDLELGLADNPEFAARIRKEEKQFKKLYDSLPAAAKRHWTKDVKVFVRELRDHVSPGPKPSEKTTEAAVAIRALLQANPNLFTSLNQ